MQTRSLSAILDAETASAKSASGDKDQVRKEIARILGAALQTRYVDNNVVMAKEAKDIPFDPNLALYYSAYLESNGAPPSQDVRSQMLAKLNLRLQSWLESGDAGEPYNNHLLHAALASDPRASGIIPPAEDNPYYSQYVQ